ncbi:RloB-like protein [Thiothrix caldifontis]|uniref:RloB-like protein n=1 Tax=Thiothrix caldifontis TaxID=525918 RepID=A0A1H4DKV9_9GAMM|nr:RloB family protein [Thiothrix caldifontis]SEA73129.1 RloB-like protein [Thiothrix caldifontis]
MARKPKSRSDTRRKGQAQKPAGKTVLIVCEGTKTEFNYFNELCHTYHLQAVHTIKVTAGGSGSNAANILHDAKKRYARSKDNGNAFDHVFCVFDRDDDKGANISFQPTIHEISKLKDFQAIYSIPSFEFWLLLHFSYTRQCFANPKQVLTCLQKEYPTYQKNQQGLFQTLQENLDAALQNAARCEQEAIECGEHNPSTKVHELIHFLRELRTLKS